MAAWSWSVSTIACRVSSRSASASPRCRRESPSAAAATTTMSSSTLGEPCVVAGERLDRVEEERERRRAPTSAGRRSRRTGRARSRGRASAAIVSVPPSVAIASRTPKTIAPGRPCDVPARERQRQRREQVRDHRRPDLVGVDRDLRHRERGRARARRPAVRPAPRARAARPWPPARRRRRARRWGRATSCSSSHCRRPHGSIRVAAARRDASVPREGDDQRVRHRSERSAKDGSGARRQRGPAARTVFGMSAAIEAHGLTKRYGRTVAVDGLSFRRRDGPRHGVRRAERRRQVDDDAPRPRARRARRRRGTCRRQALPRSARAAPRGRRAARRRRDAPRAARAQPSPLARAEQPHPGRVASTRCSSSSASPTAGRKRTGGFSLGMEQRLGIAAAMLGDPPVLLFDEPVNGLDPDGIRWIRAFLRSLAAEGRAVLVSSHLMSELEGIADELVVIGRGRLIAQHDRGRASRRRRSDGRVHVRTPQAHGGHGRARGGGRHRDVDRLRRAHRHRPRAGADRRARRRARAPARTSSTGERASLEDAFIDLTRDAVEYVAERPGRQDHEHHGARRSRRARRRAAGAPLRVGEAADGAQHDLVAAPPRRRVHPVHVRS